MNTLHVKKGDTVEVISGKSKGGRGKIVEVSPAERKVIIEGVHMVTKHLKPRGVKQQGGLIKTEGPILASKVMLVCDKCDKPTRAARRILDDGSKVRYCKHCNESF